MKLPTFQAQKGTSMASAMTTPARVGNIKERIPVTKRLAATRDVSGELALGRQKSRTALMLGKAVGDTAIMFGKIDTANQQQSAHLAISKHASQMAAYQVQLEIDRYQTDEATGKKVFEVMPQKLAEYDKILRKQLRQDLEFTNPNVVADWNMKTDAASASFQNKAQIIRNDEEVNKGKVMLQNTLDTTNDPSVAAQAIGDGAAAGLFNPDLAPAMFQDWEVDYTYKGILSRMPNYNAESASAVAEEAVAGTGVTALMSEAQRNKIVADSQERIVSIHLEGLNTVYTQEGGEVAIDKLDAMMDGGHKASGAIDASTHNKMMGVLKTSLGRQIGMSKLQYVEQGDTNTFGIYSDPNASYEDIVGLAQDFDDPAKRGSVDKHAEPYARLPTADFYSSPAVDTMLQNGVRAGYVAKGFVTRLDTDINNGVLAAIDKVEGIEAIAPLSIPLNKRSRSRLEFTKNRVALGMAGEDPFKEQQDFAAVENRGTEQKARDAKLAATNLIEIETPQEAYIRTSKDLGYTDDDYFSPDAVQPGSAAQIQWEDAYTEILPYVNMNHERAARYATTATAKSFGATTAYDGNEPVTEYNSPESIIPAPNFKSGQPNPYYDEQFGAHIDEHNELTGDNYDRTEVRREYLGKDDTGADQWIYFNLLGEPILNDNGKIQPHGYLKESPAKVKESKNTSLNTRAEFFINQQESVAGASPISLMEFADIDRDPVTGRIAETSTEATDINAKRWKEIDGKNGRAFTNRMYSEAYSMLMGSNMGLIKNPDAVNPQELEMSIHLYLNSRGYMRGDESGKFIRPPGGF